MKKLLIVGFRENCLKKSRILLINSMNQFTPNYTKADKRKRAILYCRYYNGEKDNPFHTLLSSHIVKPAKNIHEQDEYDIPQEEVEKLSMGATAFFYEGCWVKERVEGVNEEGRLAEYDYDLKDSLDSDDDVTPRTLKALFYNRYVHWVLDDYVTPEGIESFRQWYKNSYCSTPTHLQVRTAERLPGLLKKCRYYNGEKNPWEMCYAPVLVWRRKIWEFEREWAKELCISYNSFAAKYEYIKEIHLTEFFKAKEVSLSLTNLILCHFKKEAEKVQDEFGPAEAIKTIDKYLKWAPLGHGPEKYFAYFMGEEENPYNVFDKKDNSKLLWLQERIVYGNLQHNPNFISQFGGSLNHPEFEEGNVRYFDGAYGWMYDSRYPYEQRSIWLFCGTNIGTWCPYDDIDKIGEEYINFHYVNPHNQKRND